MTRIEPRALHCPHCGTAFDGWLVLAGPAAGPVASDLRRYPEGEDPIPKQLNSCPSCAYSGEVSAFEELAVPPGHPVQARLTGAWFDQDDWAEAHDPMFIDRPRPEDSTLEEQLQSFLSERAAEAHDNPAIRYEHHAQVERWIGSGPLREGDAWLRAAWLHSDAERGEDDTRCRRRALHCYRQGVSERHWFRRREDLVVIAYLVGELHRRLGEIDEGKRWFEQAIAWSSGLQQLQELVELAERQAREPSDLV